MKYKAIAIGLLLLITFFANAPGILAGEPQADAIEAKARQLDDQIMCPICPAQTIAHSSSETSQQMRDLVLKKLRQGETRQEVLAYFASRYGERVLAEPSKKGLNLLLWFLPFVFIAGAAILIPVLIWRWSRRHREVDYQRQDLRLTEYEGRLEKELGEFNDKF